VGIFLLGEKNGKEIGTMLNIVVKDAKRKKECFNMAKE
jgi:hypothetical protein